MRLRNLLWMALPVALASACATHREVVYVPTPVVTTPTSDRPASRVYSENGNVVVEPPPPPPGMPSGVRSGDLAIADSISRAFKGDSGMASLTSNVQAAVLNGVVTLTGTVPTDNDRETIRERIRHLPGVVRVNDDGVQTTLR
jgi:hypothetical protein